jgi:peptidoglycan/xylan/chitin deacetylase (PgdA/CDA1 family)
MSNNLLKSNANSTLLNTFDLEDWWHIVPCPYSPNERIELHQRTEDIAISYANFCLERRLPCIFFVVGETAKRNPGLIRYLFDKGFEIGSHSLTHPNFKTIDRQELIKELKASKEIIEDITGFGVRSFRAPNFSIGHNNIHYLQDVRMAGYTIDSSILVSKSLMDNNGTIPNVFSVETNCGVLEEYPAFAYKFFSRLVRFPGGGFLRVLPNYIIRQLLISNTYHNLYIHASDFDTKRPRISGDSFVSQIKRKIGASTMAEKVKMILTSNEVSVVGFNGYKENAIKNVIVEEIALDFLSKLIKI